MDITAEILMADDVADRWIDTILGEDPALLLHAWDGERVVSHLQAIGDFDGPYPFHDASGRLID